MYKLHLSFVVILDVYVVFIRYKTTFIKYCLTTMGFKSPQAELWNLALHYNDVIMSAMSSQITSLTIVYSTIY